MSIKKSKKSSQIILASLVAFAATASAFGYGLLGGGGGGYPYGGGN